MANISTATTDSSGNMTYNIEVVTGDTLTLPTSGTYVDKNIVLNINNSGTISTGDATASSSDIASGKSAYVNDLKLTGTLTIQDFYTGTEEPASTLGNNYDLYYKSAT